MRLRLGFVLGGGLSVVGMSPTSHIRGSHNSISASNDVEAFHVSHEGKIANVAAHDEEKIKEILCSARVLSHLHRCTEEVTDPPPLDTFSEPLYPLAAAYKHAVDNGLVCPFPAPFMHVGRSDHKCCIPTTNKNIWPNFCPEIESLGKPLGHGDVKWDVSDHFNMHGIPPSAGGMEIVRPIPEGIFRVGVPDVPPSYVKHSLSMYLIATYFVMGATCLALLVFVFNKLEEEEQIAKGKIREEVFMSRRRFIDDEDDEEPGEEEGKEESPASSHASSLSPVRDRISRGANQQEAVGLMDQVSLSFGLLPPLPRGRSTNPSSLNSPRLTAR